MSFVIATWNVNSLRARFKLILHFLQQYRPDIVALQETKLENHLFPTEIFQALGYYSVCHGQKSYNGVAILSRWPIQVVDNALPLDHTSECRLLSVIIEELHLVNIYVPNGAALDSNKYQYKLKWLNALYHYLERICFKKKYIAVVGDYNIAPKNIDVHDPRLWQDTTLTSTAVRHAFFQLMNLGLIDVFRLLNTQPKQYTWWDYRLCAIHYNRGLRIDQVVCSSSLTALCENCIIDVNTRRMNRPSDHAAVLAYFKKRPYELD